MIDKKKFIQLLKDKLSEYIFNKSQIENVYVPYRTGALKRSGKREFIDLDIVISYGGGAEDVKYARDVEFGFSSPRTVRVPPHIRKGNVRVKAFNMTFKPRIGKFFCKRAIEDILDTELENIIISCLMQMPEVISINKD